MAVAITVECHWIFRTRGKFSLNYQNPAVARRKWQIWRMFTPTAKESILRAARKSDEMLEPYEWKRSRTVLRRERAGNRPDLADYFALVGALNGQVVRLATNSKDYLNPMDIQLSHKNDREALKLKSDFIITLCDLIAGGKNGLENDEKGIIDTCIKHIYDDYFENPMPENMPILEDLYNALLKYEPKDVAPELRQEAKKKAVRIANSLVLYVHGSQNYFNHRTNVDSQNRIMCFDIRDLGNQLKELGMLIVQDAVWNRVSQNRERKIATRYYCDEFHLLLKERQTAIYSVEIWKRFRKWGGIPTGLTQNVGDFLKSEEIEGILGNSDFVYLLNQNAKDQAILADKLGLSEKQLAHVTNSEPGSGLILFDNVVIPFVDKYPSDTKTFRVMNTKPEESVKQGEKE